MVDIDSAAGAPVLAAQRVSKCFGEVPVLFSVDFDVRPGEVHALIGENGAGKSTLIKILSGIEAPTSGGIELDGKAIVLPPNGEAEVSRDRGDPSRAQSRRASDGGREHFSWAGSGCGSAFCDAPTCFWKRNASLIVCMSPSIPMPASIRFRSPTSKWWKSPRRSVATRAS